MNDYKGIKIVSVSILFLFSLIMTGLKTLGIIDWSWWIVTLLVWSPPFFVISVLLIIILVYGVYAYGKFIFDCISNVGEK